MHRNKKRDRSNAAAVAQMIRDFIDDRNLEPGEQLPTQQELSRILGVGVRKLREGMSILSHEGLVKTSGKGGTKVMMPSLDHMHDSVMRYLSRQDYSTIHLIRARARFEGAIASEAAEYRKARDLLVMLDSIERFEERIDDEEKNIIEMDKDCHLAILKAAHNPVFEVFGELIITQFFTKFTPHARLPSQIRKVTLKEHRKIYDAIQAQDAALTEKTMYEHIMAQVERHKHLQDGDEDRFVKTG